MSVYSMDSLEDDNEISSGNQDSICENADGHNLESNKITTDLPSNLEFRLQPITPLYTLKQGKETTLNTFSICELECYKLHSNISLYWQRKE